jgi:hypothetical protein
MLEIKFVWLGKEECRGGDNSDEKIERSEREDEIDVKEEVDK